MCRPVTLRVPMDVHLAVEVARTAVAHDRDVTMPLHARHGIRDCWLVDMEASCLVVYRDPSATGYWLSSRLTSEAMSWGGVSGP